MSTRSMLHQAKLNEWASRFADQKSSGLSVAAWCEQNNISQHKFFYWKRQLKEEAIEQVLPDIVPIAMPSVQTNEIPTTYTKTEVGSETCASCATFASNPSARLYINGICIELDSSANEVFIKYIIKAVRHA
ncbi:MAG: hypothetical protein K6E75_08030 [Lachnospiraceae bacterium]|nr:hypothetical protein [Lachnospiraceae bacterium]